MIFSTNDINISCGGFAPVTEANTPIAGGQALIAYTIRYSAGVLVQGVNFNLFSNRAEIRSHAENKVSHEHRASDYISADSNPVSYHIHGKWVKKRRQGKFDCCYGKINTTPIANFADVGRCLCHT